MGYTKQLLRIDLQNLARYVEEHELDEYTLQEWVVQKLEQMHKQAKELAGLPE